MPKAYYVSKKGDKKPNIDQDIKNIIFLKTGG